MFCVFACLLVLLTGLFECALLRAGGSGVWVPCTEEERAVTVEAACSIHHSLGLGWDGPAPFCQGGSLYCTLMRALTHMYMCDIAS